MAKKPILYPRISQNPPFSVEATGYQKVKGETIPRRHPTAKDKLKTSPSEDVSTVFDILKRSAAKFGNAKALGARKLIKTHNETKKVKKTIDGKTQEVDKNWTYYEMSEYSYMSFIEYEKLALQIGSALRKLGLSKGDRLHLFASTRSVTDLSPSADVADTYPPVATGLRPLMEPCHNRWLLPQHTTLLVRKALSTL